MDRSPLQRDTSDGSGKVTAQWTVGTTAGQAQQLTATVVSTGSIAPVQATASVVAGPGSALAGAVNSVSARAGDPVGAVAVAIRDKYGNATSASNIRITVRLENAAGTTLGGTLESRTDGSGSAVFTNLSTTGKAGALTLLFESDGLSPGRVSLVLSGGQPAKVATATNATFDAEALLSGPPVSAKVLDAFDNPVAAVNVSFAIDGTTIGASTSGADGVATLSTWTVPQIGTYKLVASASGVATSAQFTLNARAVAAKTLVPLANNPTTGSVGNTVLIGVTAVDAIGRAVPGAALTWTLNGVDQNVTADGNGVARFTIQLPTKSGNNPIVVRASSTVSVTINVQGLPGALVAVVPDKDSIEARAGSTGQRDIRRPGRVWKSDSEHADHWIHHPAVRNAAGRCPDERRVWCDHRDDDARPIRRLRRSRRVVRNESDARVRLRGCRQRSHHEPGSVHAIRKRWNDGRGQRSRLRDEWARGERHSRRLDAGGRRRTCFGPRTGQSSIDRHRGLGNAGQFGYHVVRDAANRDLRAHGAGPDWLRRATFGDADLYRELGSTRRRASSVSSCGWRWIRA